MELGIQYLVMGPYARTPGELIEDMSGVPVVLGLYGIKIDAYDDELTDAERTTDSARWPEPHFRNDLDRLDKEAEEWG